MKTLLPFFTICVLFTFTSCTPAPPSQSNIHIASFNIERFGEKDKDQSRLASVITNFDLIGILEVMKPFAVSNLVRTINNQTGQQWNFLISQNWQGTTFYHEYVAYIWNSVRLSLTQNYGFCPNTNHTFTRAPYAAQFSARNIDFTFVIVHLIWAGSSSEDLQRRQAEASALSDTLIYFDNQNGTDQDIILGGDFNLPTKDTSFDSLRQAFYTDALPDHTLTTITSAGLKSAYDHLFYNRIYTTEFSGTAKAFDFTQGNYATAYRVSDHLPVFMELEDRFDDD